LVNFKQNLFFHQYYNAFIVKFTPELAQVISCTFLNSIAYYSRAILQGWKNYYGKYGRAELKRVLFYLNEKLVRWAKKKYKRLKTERRAVRWIIGYRQREPKLFVHWSFT